jgi:capsular exopolysaccharide synthesis family protein
VLLGQAEAGDVIQRWRDSELYILTAGAIPPNPSELLGSEPMRELFDKLAHEFDFILIDSPPVVPVVDAVLLDRLTGGTLMIVASSRTRKRDLASAVKQLDTVGAKLIGFALNFVPVNESDARRYGYYRFQETPDEPAGHVRPVPRTLPKPRGGKSRVSSRGGRRSAKKV